MSRRRVTGGQRWQPRGFFALCLLTLVLGAVLLLLQSSPQFPERVYLGTKLFSLPLHFLSFISTSQDNTTRQKQAASLEESLESTMLASSSLAKPKLILWDPVVYWLKVPSGSEKFSKCRIKSCSFVTSVKDIGNPGQADAVIISGDTMSKSPPFNKSLGQVWIYMTHESPQTLSEFGHNGWLSPSWRSKIDLTMTYRVDSDFPIPYGKTVKMEKAESRNYARLLARKKKLVAQVSSHHCACQSKRREYIGLLRKHIPVEVLGRCGSGTCGADCFSMVNETYKFYLAFENSLCDGYVTEKFFRTQALDVVAVVRGKADYSQLFPPGSYVDTRHFRSPRALAEHVLYLDGNHTAYLAHLRAKAQYRVMPRDDVIQEAFCSLCEYLHRSPPPVRPDFDFAKWWSVETSCRPPSDLVDA